MTSLRTLSAFAAALARLLVLSAVLVAFPARAQEQPSLRPGDVVRVTVFRQQELSGEMEVGDDGTLLHPLYREVSVAGVPRAEVDARLRAFLQRYEEEPRFLWEPLVRVTVGGEVRSPEESTVRPSTTLFQAVVGAGGATPQGRMDRVLLYRDGTSRMLDLASADRPDARTLVRSGDVLVVQRRGATAREWLAPIASLTAAAAALINLLSN